MYTLLEGRSSSEIDTRQTCRGEGTQNNSTQVSIVHCKKQKKKIIKSNARVLVVFIHQPGLLNFMYHNNEKLVYKLWNTFEMRCIWELTLIFFKKVLELKYIASVLL